MQSSSSRLPRLWGEAPDPLAAAMRVFSGHLVEELCRALTMTPQVLDGRPSLWLATLFILPERGNQFTGLFLENLVHFH